MKVFAAVIAVALLLTAAGVAEAGKIGEFSAS